MDAIQSAIAKKEILDSLRPIDPEREQIIMQKFRLDWNYHSNHIEGNSLSYGETKALVLFGITGSAKPLKDYLEVEGHNAAIDWVLDVIKDKHELTENFIRELHTLLLKPTTKEAITPDGKATTRRIEVGQYKKQPNHVITKTGETFRFATPEETPAKMHDLIEWYREQRKSGSLNPILLAAEFHYKFVRIHPFDDGNGRMARILMNFILMQYSYPPVIIKTDNKEEYYIALQQADAGVITPFIEYVAENLNNSLDIMIAGANGESIEEPDDIDKELLLLEQEINNTTKKIEKYRDEDVCKEVLQSVGAKSLLLFKVRMDMIKPYYKQQQLMSYVNDNLLFLYTDIFYKKPIEDILNNKSINWSRITSIAFKVRFQDFLPIPKQNSTITIENFENIIALEFYATYYQLSNNNNMKIAKLYTEQLSDQEIDRIIKGEALKHFRFIAQKQKDLQ